MEKRGNWRGAGLLLAGLAAVVGILTLAPSAGAAAGTFDRAWGKNVNGGGVFGICTVAANCLAGSVGGLGGEMNNPASVATDAAGNVYLADTNNHRIQKFDSAGTFERTWGKAVNMTTGGNLCTAASGNTCQAGSTGGLGGEMEFSRGVATDGAGNVYVVDQNNNRIQKFNSAGTFERAWGENVIQEGMPGDTAADGFEICTAAADCQAGTDGGLGGEMNFPTGVATDGASNVYLADESNHRIQKFNSSGTFERTWGKAVNMTTGGNLCTAASGNTCQAGSTGGLGGEMNGPLGVATDAAGNVYLADESNHRIQKFDSSGTFERTWGKAVNMTTPGNLCTAASGNTCQAGTTGGLGGEMNQPAGVATDASGNVYLADTNNYRIQKFDSAGTFERTWGKEVNMTTGGNLCTAASGATCQAGNSGGRGGEMDLPHGVATDASANVYLADRSNHRIQKFVKATPTISTQATANATLGGQISDQATIAGGSNPGGTITFTAYGPDDATCANAPAYTSNAIAVSGNGNYNSAPAFTPGATGTYRWRASYSGDANNVAVATACNDPNETSVVSPAVVPPVIPPALVTPPATTTGQRAAALKKCKKKRGRARRNCKKRANKLPV
jgi:hypothetical protein